MERRREMNGAAGRERENKRKRKIKGMQRKIKEIRVKEVRARAARVERRKITDK